jgi:hypothetical protein
MNGNGVDGVEKIRNKTKTRKCNFGCGKGIVIDETKSVFLCNVPVLECERDGRHSLSITKKGSLMG